MTEKRHCEATRRDGRPCPRPALEGRTHCQSHDREHLASAGRVGRAKQLETRRAEREALASALTVATVGELRATLEAATRQAFIEGDWSTVVSAVRAGTELLRAGDLEAQVRELRELVESYVRRGPLGVVR